MLGIPVSRETIFSRSREGWLADCIYVMVSTLLVRYLTNNPNTQHFPTGEQPNPD